MRKALGVFGILILGIIGYFAYAKATINTELREMHEHEVQQTSITQ